MKLPLVTDAASHTIDFVVLDDFAKSCPKLESFVLVGGIPASAARRKTRNLKDLVPCENRDEVLDPGVHVGSKASHG